MWLSDHDIDILCVRLKPYDFNGHVLVDVQQIIPIPEAADYQIQMKEKTRQERKSRGTGPDFTRFDITIGGQRYPLCGKGMPSLLFANIYVTMV